MSATLANAPQVAAWLGAACYQTGFRPVPLVQYLKDRAVLKDSRLQEVRRLDCAASNPLLGRVGGEPFGAGLGRWTGAEAAASTAPAAAAAGPVTPDLEASRCAQRVCDHLALTIRPSSLACPCALCPQDGDHAPLLAKETVDAGHSVLVFCGTKRSCEEAARDMAKCAQGPPGWAAEAGQLGTGLLDMALRSTHLLFPTSSLSHTPASTAGAIWEPSASPHDRLTD